MRLLYAGAALAVAVILGSPARAQEPSPDATPAVGTVAPDFTVIGATRFGVLQDPVQLSDFRGKTVVLAFFFRARTPG